MNTISNSSREFVIGDIHGAHIALQQCLERCGFDKDKDLLIVLGDICDGWPYVYECVEELLTIKNRIDLIGNHDDWFREWLITGIHPEYWGQGGKGTAQSYLRNAGKDGEDFGIFYLQDGRGKDRVCYTFDLTFADIPPSHAAFFKNQHLYYKDGKDRLFVHAGFYDKELTLRQNQKHNPSDFYWNRDLWQKAMSAKGGRMKFTEPLTEIFIGHTATTKWTTKEIRTDAGIIIPLGDPITTPMFADIMVNLDTGAGSIGKLTIMDINTHEYWQSDNVKDIYGEYKPRL